MESRRARKKDKTIVFPNPITTSSTPVFGLGLRLNLSSSENSLSPISQSSDASHTSTLSFKNMQIKPKSNRPQTISMICKAIEELGSDKSGSSVPAIKKWILGNYTDLTESRLKTSLKKAFVKGLTDGTLVRPRGSKSLPGAVGCFCLPKKGAPKKDAKNSNGLKKTKISNKKAKQVSKEPEELVSDSEVTIVRNRKSIRMNVSDTELNLVRKSIIFEEKPKRSRKAVPFKSKVEKNSEESDTEPKKSVSKTKTKKPLIQAEEKVATAKSLTKTNVDSVDKENSAPRKKKANAADKKPVNAAVKKPANAADKKPAKAVNKEKQAPVLNRRKKT